jgi:hypothetical protein
MRLVQDTVLLSCLLFAFYGATSTDIASPLQALWGHVQLTLESALPHSIR